ncbi:MAG TPA: META domain-containing protein [Gemmatimonadaceae bacterium]|nr:META domain-containing protein [Gemmatimonadaceae bacterium]
MRPYSLIFGCLILALGCAPADDAAIDSLADQPTPPAAPMDVSPTLENTRWELVQVADTLMVPTDLRNAPYFRLVADSARAVGHTGCNQMSGGYSVKGDSLSFSAMVMTRMACVGPGMNVEVAFTGALDQTRSWSMTGDTLRLLDAAGAPLARLVARPQ